MTNRTAWIAAAVVAWGAWNAQTDGYPFDGNQARPYWFMYGWPLCFGTKSRLRFPLNDFEPLPLAIDLLVSVALILITYKSIERLMRYYPRFPLRLWFSIATGISLALAVSDIFPTVVDRSGSPGNFVRLSAYGELATIPLTLAWFGIGALAFDALVWAATRFFGRRT